MEKTTQPPFPAEGDDDDGSRNNTSSSDSSKIEERTIRRRVFVRRSAYGRSSNHDGVEEDNSFENSTRREEKDWELKLFNVDDGTNTAAAKYGRYRGLCRTLLWS